MSGFRKGKVPEEIVKKNLGSVIDANFAESSLNEYYRKAIEENPDIGIREFANSIGEDFFVVWEILGFKDWFDPTIFMRGA